MYEVKLNGTVIHQSDTESIARLSSGIITEDINQIPSFSFTVPPMNPVYSQELNDRSDIITVTNTLTGENEFEGHLLTHTSSMNTSGRFAIKAVAEGFLGYLCDSIQMYHNYIDNTPSEFLTALLDAHNAQVTANGYPEKRIVLGLVDVTKSDYKRSKTTAYRNTLEEIQVNLIDRIGGEIRVRSINGTLVLDYLENIGVTCSTKIELAKNMKSLQVETDSSNIITRLIPLGYQPSPGDSAERLTIASVNGGLPYIDDAVGIEKYGIIAGTVVFDDITQPANLKNVGQEYLTNNNRIRKAYEAQALDLSLLDTSQQALRCGNIYTFVNSFMGIDEPLRLVGRTVDIYKPYSPTLRIGDKSVRITDIATRTARLIEYEMPKQKQEILESAKATATALITAGITGYVVVNGNEILIMDTPDKSTATKVWRWNSGGFGYSSTGYNGTYGTAITMNGAIVADFITAGVLRGIEILNGNGTFHVDENGNVTASAFTMTGGRIDMTTNSQIYDAINLNYRNQNNELWSSQLSPLQLDLRNTGIDKRLLVQAGGIFLYNGGTAITQINDGNISASGNISAAGNVTATGNISATGNVYADELKFKLNGNVYDTGSIIATLWNEVFGGGM